MSVPISRAAAAVVGFLARYSSKNTVSAFALDLRLLFQWCAAQGLDPLDATRTHLELFARYLEDERGNGPASVHRRLSTITCFYRMAEIDNYLDRHQPPTYASRASTATRPRRWAWIASSLARSSPQPAPPPPLTRP